MAQSRFLVTGALGCIGSWVVSELSAAGEQVVVLDAAGDAFRLRYLLDDEALGRVTFARADITDLAAVRDVVTGHDITNVIHLAALQVPSCRANPSAGAAVNVVGTVNVFSAVQGTAAAGNPIVYASSVAAYDEAGDDGTAVAEPTGSPRTHYGVYKRANEGGARVFWHDDGLASVGLRPYVVYGVGRDTGLTAGPTFAMLAAAQGRPYRIGYGGRSHLQHAADVARAFIHASRSGFRGAEVFNLAGSVVHMREVVAAIEATEPATAGTITFDEQALPFPGEVDSAPLERALGPVPQTPLIDGVADTIGRFRRLLADGRMAPAEG